MQKQELTRFLQDSMNSGKKMHLTLDYTGKSCREVWLSEASYLVSMQYLQERPVDLRVVQKAGLNLVHIADGVVELHRIRLQGHLGFVLLVQQLLFEVLSTVAVVVRILLTTI